MYYRINERLEHLNDPVWDRTAMIAVTLSREDWEVLKTQLGFPDYAGIDQTVIRSCRAEAYARYIYGSLCVPNPQHLQGHPTKLAFYINESYLVIIENSGLADKVIGRMVHRYQSQNMTPEFFLYGFFQEFLKDDIELLEKYETQLFLLEEDAWKGNLRDLLPTILKSRRELTILRNYYEQMEDLAREIESNVKGYFVKENLAILGTLSERADRLQSIAQQSIEYCQTLRDSLQALSDHKQNKTIQFLTILTSIFFPLTVITGWYGMNFAHMPEIESRFGYPGVIVVSGTVIAVEFLILKWKKMI